MKTGNFKQASTLEHFARNLWSLILEHFRVLPDHPGPLMTDQQTDDGSCKNSQTDSSQDVLAVDLGKTRSKVTNLQ